MRSSRSARTRTRIFIARARAGVLFLEQYRFPRSKSRRIRRKWAKDPRNHRDPVVRGVMSLLEIGFQDAEARTMAFMRQQVRTEDALWDPEAFPPDLPRSHRIGDYRPIMVTTRRHEHEHPYLLELSKPLPELRMFHDQVAKQCLNRIPEMRKVWEGTWDEMMAGDRKDAFDPIREVNRKHKKKERTGNENARRFGN